MITQELKPSVGSAAQQTSRANAWFTYAVSLTLLCWYSTHAIRTLIHGQGKDIAPLRVLGSFWASGWAAKQHLNPYGVYPIVWQFYAYPNHKGPLIYDVNLSPPGMMPLFQLLALIPLRPAVVGWTIASVLLFGIGTLLLVAARRGEIQKRKIVWLLLSSSFLDTLWLGQDYALMFLVACVAWWLIESDEPGRAGIVIGMLIAMKPNLGLWPLLMFVGGYKRPAILSAVTAALLSAFPVFLYGSSIYWEWLRAALQIPHYIFTSDLSLPGEFQRLGYRPAGIVAAVLLAGWLIFFVWRRRPSLIDVCGISICGGIFCAPLAWHHYALMAAPFFAMRKPWGRLETWAAFLLALPCFTQLTWRAKTQPGRFWLEHPTCWGSHLCWSLFRAAPRYASGRSCALRLSLFGLHGRETLLKSPFLHALFMLSSI